MTVVQRHSTRIDFGQEEREGSMLRALDLESSVATRNGVVTSEHEVLSDVLAPKEGGSGRERFSPIADKVKAEVEENVGRIENLADTGEGDETDGLAEDTYKSSARAAKTGVQRTARRVRKMGSDLRKRRWRKLGRGRGSGKAARSAAQGAKAASETAAKGAEETAKRVGRAVVRTGGRATRALAPGVIWKLVTAAAGALAFFVLIVVVLVSAPKTLSDTELSVAAHLYSKGYTTEAIAGVMGNLYQDGYFDTPLIGRAKRPGDFDIDKLVWKPGKLPEWDGFEYGEEDMPAGFDELAGMDSVAKATWAYMFGCAKPALKTEGSYSRRLSSARTYYNSLMHVVDRRTLIILTCAYSQLGVDYIWGWARPDVGLDCSGLTMWCYRQAGISIPKYSEHQARVLEHVGLEEARPGDILWRSGHVAIFIGDDRYIHAMDEDHGVLFGEGIQKFTCALRYVE